MNTVIEWASSVLGAQNIQAGAIDVIAVRHSDGSITCSPFHVKLGKIPKKGEKKIVTLKVNGQDVSLSMKLGPAGEAFFVERTRERTQEELWNSPPLSPGTASYDYDNPIENFPLTSAKITTLSERMKRVDNDTDTQIRPNDITQSGAAAVTSRQRSYSEGDLASHNQQPPQQQQQTQTETVVDATNAIVSKEFNVSHGGGDGHASKESSNADLTQLSTVEAAANCAEQSADTSLITPIKAISDLRITTPTTFTLPSASNSTSATTIGHQKRDRSYSDLSNLSSTSTSVTPVAHAMYTRHTPVGKELLIGRLDTSPRPPPPPTTTTAAVKSSESSHNLANALIEDATEPPATAITASELGTSSNIVEGRDPSALSSDEQQEQQQEQQQNAQPPAVSWIWSWGALPKKSKPSKHHSAGHGTVQVAEAKTEPPSAVRRHSHIGNSQTSLTGGEHASATVGTADAAKMSSAHHHHQDVRQTADDDDAVLSPRRPVAVSNNSGENNTAVFVSGKTTGESCVRAQLSDVGIAGDFGSNSNSSSSGSGSGGISRSVMCGSNDALPGSGTSGASDSARHGVSGPPLGTTASERIVSLCHEDDSTISLVSGPNSTAVSRNTSPVVSGRKVFDAATDTTSSPALVTTDELQGLPPASHTVLMELENVSEAKPPRAGAVPQKEYRETANDGDSGSEDEIEDDAEDMECQPEVPSLQQLVMMGEQPLHAEPSQSTALPDSKEDIGDSDQAVVEAGEDVIIGERNSVDENEEDEDDDGIYVEDDQHRMLSLCGHILSGDPESGMTAPQTSEELRSILFAYRVKNRDLNSENVEKMNQLLENRDLVVVIDDYLLTIDLVEQLLLMTVEAPEMKTADVAVVVSSDGTDPADKSSQIEPVVGVDTPSDQAEQTSPESTATEGLVLDKKESHGNDGVNEEEDDESQELNSDTLKLTDEMVASVCNDHYPDLPSWVGKKISQWGVNQDSAVGVEDALESEAEIEAAEGMVNFGNGAEETEKPLAVEVDETTSVKRRSNTFHGSSSAPLSAQKSSPPVKSSSRLSLLNELNWRESFSDLAHAFKAQSRLSGSHAHHSLTVTAGITAETSPEQHQQQSVESRRSRSHDDGRSTCSGAFAVGTHETFLKAYLASSPHASSGSLHKLHSHEIKHKSARRRRPSHNNDSDRRGDKREHLQGRGQAHEQDDNENDDFYIPTSHSADSQEDGSQDCNFPFTRLNRFEARSRSHSSSSGGGGGERSSFASPSAAPFVNLRSVSGEHSNTTSTHDTAHLTELLIPLAEHENEDGSTVVTPIVSGSDGSKEVNGNQGTGFGVTGNNEVTEIVMGIEALESTENHLISTTNNDNNNNNDSPSLQETDIDAVSLEDIELDDICPEPAGGDFYDSDTDSYLSLSFDGGESDNGSRGRNRSNKHTITATNAGATASGTKSNTESFALRKKYHYRKVLVPNQEQLECLNLRDGENEISFQLDGCVPLKAQLFVWPENSKIIVTDIEGVLTRNNSRNSSGWVSFLGGGSSKNMFNNDCNTLFNHVIENNYRILYITQTNMTPLVSSKDYLAGIVSTKGQKIPNGPIFKSPDSLIRAFGAERTDVFKAAALRGVKSLFPHNHNPYHACFGTKECDINAYSRFGFPEGRIFMVNEKGDLRTSHRLKTVSFKDLDDLKEEMFPYVPDPVKRPVSIVPDAATVALSAAVAASSSSAATFGLTASCGESMKSVWTIQGAASPMRPGGVQSLTSPSHSVRASANPTPVPTPSVTSTAEDSYNDFNYWRTPVPILED